MIHWFFLALMVMASCQNNNGSNSTHSTVSQPEADVETKKSYENLLNMDPVELDASKVSSWPGLINIGNTCFMNSTLKLMARQKELLNMLNEQEDDKNDSDILELRKALKAVINMIRLADNSPGKDTAVNRYALESLRFRMSKIPTLDRLSNCKQHDANEFYAGFDGALSLFKDTPNNQVIKLLAAKKDDGTLYKARFVKAEPLAGAFSVTKDSDLNAILQDFTKFEVTDKDNYLVAEEGQGKVPHVQKLYFTGLDKSIVIPVQTTVPGPNETLEVRKFVVTAPQKLKISYLSDVSGAVQNIGALNNLKYESEEFKRALPNETESWELDLSAMVIHGGSAAGGHYWAYIKDDQNKWYKNNDGDAPTLVADLEIEKNTGDGPNPQVYMYLYE